jgi:glycerol-1-phosphate dehydrogenase [NAD(P)+]
MAVVLKDGVKRTVPSAWPRTLIIDTRVLVCAPSVLTRSGFGEMMAMFTAPADWRLAAELGFDEFDPAVVGVFRERAGELLQSSTGLRTGEEEALELLATLLTTSGLAMAVVGKTAPLSGMEHVISHLIDMSAHADGRAVGLHGAQVGVASLVAACVWERLLSDFDPDDLLRPAPPAEQLQRRVHSAFSHLDARGAMAAECWSDYQHKLTSWNHAQDHRRRLANSWQAVRVELAKLAGEPAAIAKALAEVGAPARFGHLDPPLTAATARWAVAASPLMRQRFTVADLAFFTGHWTDEDVAAVLDRAAEVGGGL